MVILQAGERYDLQVVYRLVALLLSLSGESAAMSLFASAFRDLPSYKLVPLVYQVGFHGAFCCGSLWLQTPLLKRLWIQKGASLTNREVHECSHA
jgi:hypothetical protein